MPINKTITILTLIFLIAVFSQPSNVMAKSKSASIDVILVVLPFSRSMSMDIGGEDITQVITNESNEMIVNEAMLDEAMNDLEERLREEYYQDDILVTTHRTEESVVIQFTKTE